MKHTILARSNELMISNELKGRCTCL